MRHGEPEPIAQGLADDDLEPSRPLQILRRQNGHRDFAAGQSTRQNRFGNMEEQLRSRIIRRDARRQQRIEEEDEDIDDDEFDDANNPFLMRNDDQPDQIIQEGQNLINSVFE